MTYEALHDQHTMKVRHARRRELEDCLRTSRCAPPPMRVPAGEPHGRRNLSRGLVEMGPAFALFGRYLATRIDILPATLCEELADIPDLADPTTPAMVREVFVQELRCQPERAFLVFEAQPFESRLLWQAHHATLGNSDVVVKIIHPRVREWMSDAEFLPILSKSLADCGVSAGHFSAAVEDFRRELAAAQTFLPDIEASSLFVQDAQSFDMIGAPRLLTHLCSPHVAVYEPGSAMAGRAAPDPDLARTLCLAWLRQALQGQVYPVDPRIENIALTSEGRVLFHAGPFASLAARSKAHLLDYLIAAAAENIDEAYSHLSQETAAGRAGTVDEELRRCFRQTVAFRDGVAKGIESFGHRSASDRRFTDEVLIHWRFTSGRGPMDSSLVSFYRGLFTLVKTARKIAPDRDSLAEALYDLRVMTTFGQALDMMRPSEISGLLERYATAFLNMPQQMDRLLANRTSPAAGSRRKASRAALISLLLALGGIAMLFNKLGETAKDASADRLLVSLFVGIGLILLWMGSRLA